MEINAKITLLVNNDVVRLEIQDDDSSTTFLRAELTSDQFVRALSRQAHVAIEKTTLMGIERVGKTMENEYFVFELPENYSKWDKTMTDEQLADHVNTLLDDGWVSDRYFGSQNSFFEKDGKKYGRAVIRRWV